MNESSAATIGGLDTDRRPEKPSIPALNRVIASVNIRLPGCIVLRSSWGKVLIRLLFRVVGLDISESPRRSIVLGPRALLSSPFLLLPVPSLLPSPLLPSRFLACLALTRPSLYTPPTPSPRSYSLSTLGVLSSRGNTVPLSRSTEGMDRGGWVREERRVCTVDGVFRGGDMESGNSCLAG